MVKTKCLVFSRVCGYIQPVEQWNIGMAESFKNRKMFSTQLTEKDL